MPARKSAFSGMFWIGLMPVQAAAARERAGVEVERAPAQLADEQAEQEVLLGGGGALEKRPQPLVARGRRALAGGRCDVAERVVDLAQRQPRFRRRRAAQLRERRPADADAALLDLARKVRDGDLHLVGRRAAQALGDRVALREPARRLGCAVGRVDEGGEQRRHGSHLRTSRIVKAKDPLQRHSQRARDPERDLE